MADENEKKKNGKVKIFLSHKVGKDKETAEKIKKAFEGFVVNKFDVYISEDITIGNQWRDDICKELEDTEVFIFLYTSPLENWDWCHFEGGLFIDLKSFDNKKTFCLHGTSIEKPPSPFESFQNISATTDNIITLLNQLVIGDIKDPIKLLWCEQNEEKIKSTAEAIAKIVEDAVVKDYDFEIPSLSIVYKESKINESKIKIKKNSYKTLFAETIDDENEINWSNMYTIANQENGLNSVWLDKLKTCLDSNDFSAQIDKCHHKAEGGDIKKFSIHFQSLQELGSGSKKLNLLFIQQPKDITIPINSFDTFIDQITYLIDNSENENIRFLAYTPSIGHIAKRKEVWIKLKKKLISKSNKIEIICLDNEDNEDNEDNQEFLSFWHNEFVGRETDRGYVTQDIAKEATDEAEEILSEIKNKHGVNYVHRLPFSKMPRYYLFKTSNYAVSVIPFFVPPFESENAPNVEMIGVATNNTDLIDKIDALFQHYLKI